MILQYDTVYQSGADEIIEKKSRFLSVVEHVESEEEALAVIECERKKHYNARHHCFAYVIGQRYELQRCSDDGEPAGTAGKPILDVLLGRKLHNTVIVVTRYFGGTLLGTGGLVRAYSQAAQAGIASSVIITKKFGCKLLIQTDYTGLGKIQYLLAQKEISILNSDYQEQVRLTVLVPDEEKKILEAELIEGTNGQVLLEWQESCYFAEVNGEQLLFEDETNKEN